MMREGMGAIRRELGGLGLASLGVLAAAILCSTLVVRPLEGRSDRLKETLAASSARSATSGAGSVSQTAEKLAALYAHLETREPTTELLARLYAAGAATGVELRSAEYRLQPGGGRIERYEVTLPATGSYAQIRAFLGKALADIPALSLDQVKFHKQRANDAQVQAEMRLTFHIVRP
jgi:Tfp pilus assembly protein PilO